MKKNLILSSFLISLSSSLFAVDLASCKGCHGQNYEKEALGKSKIIKNMTKEELLTSLKGYKDGTYGGPMKGIMKGQLVKYSENDIEEMVNEILNQTEGEKVNN